jgi:hypothetical protein
LLDAIPTPSVDGKWVSKRDKEHVADLHEVTWVGAGGVRFLNPEIVSLFKAAGSRAKDRFDLDHAWPLLAESQRRWLRDRLRRLYPEHPWNERLSG